MNTVYKMECGTLVNAHHSDSGWVLVGLRVALPCRRHNEVMTREGPLQAGL